MRAIGYFVLGAAATVVVQRLMQRKIQAPASAGSNVIDLQNWKAQRG